jgi:putative FmdB family regulatory protein
VPTYTYLCTGCGEVEVQQNMSDPPLEKCPKCGEAVKKVIAPGGSFIMKGRGSSLNCGREAPCCGRETRCDKPPCGK